MTDSSFDPLSDKIRRSIEWNSEILRQLLKQIQTSRSATPSTKSGSKSSAIKRGDTVLDEVAEVIELLPYKEQPPAGSLQELDSETAEQVRDFVTAIALLYKANPFHNFEVCFESMPNPLVF